MHRSLAAALGLALMVMPGCSVAYGPLAHPLQFPLAFGTIPLDTNMNGEERGDDWPLRDDTKHLTLNSVVDVEWGRNGVGHIAKLHGLDEVHYADLRILSVLGIWSQAYVQVYGTSSPEAREALRTYRAEQAADESAPSG